MEGALDRIRRDPALALRIALGLFVLAWIFGPYALRAAVPVWLPFLVAVGLELHFFAGAFRSQPAETPDRGPQAVDRERYGYPEPEDDLPEPADDEAGDEGDLADEEDAWLDEEPWEPEREAQRFGAARRFAAGLAVIAALGLVVAFVERGSGWDGLSDGEKAEATARFSEEASRIAGKPVTVECDETGEHVGAVQHADGAAVVGGEVAWLTPERCHDLYRLAFEGETRSSWTGRAIAVLAHEAWHLRGVSNEATTECYALQSGVALGQRLGLSEERARQLMRQQLAENARRGPASFEYRVPPECRAGGELDLNPERSEFP